jgi:hypothetical protein
MILCEDYESWIEAYDNGTPVIRVINADGKEQAPQYLYRVMAVDEWNIAKRTGVFKPRPGERIHASSQPHQTYGSGIDTVTVRFDYHATDGWRAKWGDELYAVTNQSIPFDHATMIE